MKQVTVSGIALQFDMPDKVKNPMKYVKDSVELINLTLQREPYDLSAQILTTGSLCSSSLLLTVDGKPVRKAPARKPVRKVAKSAIVVEAECHSDDRVYEVKFDAEKWLLNAKPKAIIALAKCGWGGDYPADEVALWYAAGRRDMSRNREVRAMFDYIEHYNKGSKEHIGFECHVDSVQALKWLSKYRAPVHSAVLKALKDQ